MAIPADLEQLDDFEVRNPTARVPVEKYRESHSDPMVECLKRP
jgi:hypothetical protein